MKRLMMLIPFLVIGIFGFGEGNENYVVLENNGLSTMDSSTAATVTSEYTVGDRLLCKRVSLGMKFSKIILENGEKVNVSTANIKSYRLNNALYFKLPFFENGKNTNQMVFMQLVGVKGGYNLFKYENFMTGSDKRTGTEISISPETSYLVYRGDQYAYDVTEDNYKDVFKTFGVKVIE